MGRFFIIGNGFDLHHNLPTSFSRFKNYVKEKSQKDFEQITSFFLILARLEMISFGVISKTLLLM